MRSKLNSVFFAMILAMALAAAALAQQPAERAPAGKSRPAQQTQRETGDAQEKTDAERSTLSADEAMRRAISSLSTQVNKLANELKLMRRLNERYSITIEILICEEQLSRVLDKLDAVMEQKADLDFREAELQSRMRNIQHEVILRGGLYRDEAEEAIRAELQRALENTKKRLQIAQQRISELQLQAARLRERAGLLRRMPEPIEQREQ